MRRIGSATRGGSRRSRLGAEEQPPANPRDLERALYQPNELDDSAILWLIDAKYGRSFRDAIRLWKMDRSINEDGLAATGVWFPPGVPELPQRLR